MYAGSTLNGYSGHLLGAHQKIDRVARRHLEKILPGVKFPTTRTILKFEGNNGPDGIKRKSPAQNEPWHYIQPFDETDVQLIKLIEHDYRELVKALKTKDNVKAAFQAAWLAHAVVDGLTPAHHYPYEEKLVELYGGESISNRTSIAKKLILPGSTTRQQLQNNWKMWGPKGLFTTHAAFEDGFAVLIAPLRINKALPAHEDLMAFRSVALRDWYRAQAQTVAGLEMYSSFYKDGWTTVLARQVRKQLAPILVQAVTLVWYGACIDAGLMRPTHPAKGAKT